MKTFSKFFTYAAVAAFALSSCTSEKLKNDELNSGKTVTVHFGAETTDPSSKATLTPNDGETAFQAAWENDDALSVYYLNANDQEGTISATWNGKSFNAELPTYIGEWTYDAAYPVPDAIDSHVDFGSNRTQKGNAYNSKYDIMIGSASANKAAAGKDDSGKNIVFEMDRQTAIAYFHFTSDLNEVITSATLTVSGDGAAIASSSAYVNNFVWTPTKDLQSITITFPEQAPKATDFKLWFNVLPTKYETMSLTVETATKTFTISKDTQGKLAMYDAGKLYKVKKDGIVWTDKPVTPTTPTITKIKSASEFTAGTYIIMTYDESYYVPNAAATNAGPKPGNVAKTDGVITITRDMIWNATVSGEGLEFTSYVEPDKKLWGAPTNDGVRVNNQTPSKSSSSVWTFEAVDGYGCCGYAASSGTDKYYLSTYDTKDWRNYKSSNLSDKNKAANFFKVEGWVDPNHSISIATVDGGTLSASPASAAKGTEVTLTATPDKGYEFKNDWKVTSENGDNITVEAGKFTMPDANVNVTASFNPVPYLEVSASTKTVPAAGGTVTLTVDTNAGDWIAKSDNTAFVVGTPSDNTVNITVSKNTEQTERPATITVKAGALQQTINLKQSGVGSTSKESVVIILDAKDLSSTVTTEESEVSAGDVTFVLSTGAKQQSSSSAKNAFSENASILIGRSGAYIYNKTAIPGVITKFEIYANAGASTKVTVGVNFSNTSISSYDATAANTYTAKLSTVDCVYDCSEKLPNDAKYFWYQVTNSNNSQVQFRITYIPD